ncbi:MAG: TylF/MycF/NovP-related O-methyltransferase [Coleofasciculaceae cyanobacterium]
MSVFRRSFHLAHAIHPQGGTCLEFGVHVGNTYIWQAKEILKNYPQSQLIGFDSWQGLPEEASGIWVPERHRKGQFSSSKEVVTRRLYQLTSPSDDRFSFVDGFFSDSLTDEVRKNISDIIFVNIDVDLYKSTIDVLDFLKPLCKPGLIIYWDDWKDPADQHEAGWGEHLAFTNWIKENEDVKVETLEIDPINRRAMIVTEVNGMTLADCSLSISDIRYKASSTKTDDFDQGYEEYLKIKEKLRKLPFLQLMKSIYYRFIA